MKKIWSILLVGVILGMTACSDDNDKTEIPDEILGTWKLQNMEIGTLNATDADIKEIAEDVFTELTKEFYYGEEIDFYDDGTGTFKGEDMKYSIKKGKLTIYDDEGYGMSFSYSVSSSKLILTLDMREVILNEMTDDLSQEQINYIKNTLKQFTVDFTCVR